MAATRLRFLEVPAHERGLRVLAISRPGYGASTRLPARAIVDVVADTDHVLHHLGVHQCVVIGWSGGGPHALACAARLSQATATAVIASGAPYPAGGLDWMTGMAAGNVTGFSAAIEGEAALRPLLERDRPAMLDSTADDLLKVMAEGVAEVDRSHVTGPLVEDLLASNHVGLQDGVDGWCDDALALVRDWGWRFSEIRTPTTLWHGQDDRLVPYSHGRWLADHVPGVTPHLLPDEGHFSIVSGRMGEILDELLRIA
ncbi:alpha/beta hydrolase [Nocardioides sp. BSK12Z-4]|uniref:Alpha/beta hydrolase n=1 Tax=Nocardioides bruguierae TaxID=2945102 RepID=A0A9X2ICW9_9ACTN|nr:alpha/beta hydrolase [Nocardioides bruguierae]